jgi:uncharacterized protein involved in exopolysaccharide biosynthesis
MARDPARPAEEAHFIDLVLPLAEHLKLLIVGSLLVGLAALGITFLITPTYTARSSLLPPQQHGSAASALASLGALAGLAGNVTGIKNPAEQYVALMQSTTVADRLIERHRLMQVYESKYRADARKELHDNLRFSVGKKDGLITVEADDEDPRRAADLANGVVEELRHLSSNLALSEAQQRRQFFEIQLQQARDRLSVAQRELQASGYSAGAMKAEPRAAAEGYARVKAEATAAEVRLQTLRRTFAEDSPEVQQLQATLAALRAQLARAERASEATDGPDYVGKFREFKYHETLFELLARQYEAARVDESREGALIQVVDKATPPERRSRPKRALVAIGATLTAFLVLGLLVMARQAWQRSAADPANAGKVARLRAALGRPPRP